MDCYTHFFNSLYKFVQTSTTKMEWTSKSIEQVRKVVNDKISETSSKCKAVNKASASVSLRGKVIHVSNVNIKSTQAIDLSCISKFTDRSHLAAKIADDLEVDFEAYDNGILSQKILAASVDTSNVVSDHGMRTFVNRVIDDVIKGEVSSTQSFSVGDSATDFLSFTDVNMEIKAESIVRGIVGTQAYDKLDTELDSSMAVKITKVSEEGFSGLVMAIAVCIAGLLGVGVVIFMGWKYYMRKMSPF